MIGGENKQTKKKHAIKTHATTKATHPTDLKISGLGMRLFVMPCTLVSSVFSSSASSSVSPGGNGTGLPADAPISAGISDKESEPRPLFGEFRLMSVCEM